MRIVSKKPSWKHITFKTPKIGFSEWAKNGVTIRIKDDEYIFRSPDEIHQLNVCINPSFHGNDSCYITVSELKRVLRSGGEFYITLCSKKMWSFKEAVFPMVDENTVSSATPCALVSARASALSSVPRTKSGPNQAMRRSSISRHAH